MASPKLRRPENVEGDIYVDSTCIDCDTCRWMAPETFDAAGGQSRVHHQPADEESRRRALMALLACPTASIGDAAHHDLKAAMASLPDRLADLDGRATGDRAADAQPADGAAGVYHCGYHAESSFGAASYLLVRPGGNVLVDSPRFAAPLVKRLEALGGARWLFLTHKDDVADQAKFAQHFGATRVMHEGDLTPDLRGIERVVGGNEPVALEPDLLVIPTPGHTEGSACLLARETFLFTGDHLAWSARRGQIVGFRDACWYDWSELVESTRRLLPRTFSWILPGHGRRCHFAPDEMARQMQRCVEWMTAR